MSGVLNDCDTLLQGAVLRVIPNGLAALVQDAADAADAAQADADAANLLLADIASDNKLTPGEKPDIVAKRDEIVAEQVGIEASATALGVTTEKTAYTAAITALTNYLASAPLTGWNTIPGNTISIIGTDMRAKFGDVYAKRQALRNAITTATATKAVWVNISGAGKPEDGATVGAPAGTLVNGVPVANITTAVTNFNASNDRNAAALVIPTILADGSAVDHTIRKDGAADVSFEWTWTGAEGDIDGFLVYVYQSTSSFAYTFGSTPALETVYTVPASKRAFILFGAAADLYTTFGVTAYRSVDKDVNATGVIKSPLVKPGLAAENPYRPSLGVAFGGDITGTINGTAAATLVANAAAGKAASDAVAVIADDNVLSRGEKSDVIRQWDTVIAERGPLGAQALALGVSNAAYEASITALSNYLGGVSGGWNVLTTDSPIVGADFRANWTAYYTAKQALLNAIASAAARSGFSSYKTWDFRGTLDGWQNIGGITSMSFTSDSMIIDSGGADPIFRSPYGLALPGSLYNVLRMKVKRLAGTAGSSWDGTLFWSTTQFPTEGGSGQALGIPDITILNEWVILEWNMSKVAEWTGRTVQYVRPDLGGSAADTFEIDWISLGRYGPAVSVVELAAAQAAADAANAALADIANDNILSRGEKPEVILKWDAIVGEVTGLINQAASLGVSSSAYVAAYSALEAYLPGAQWNSTGVDTVIVGATFRAKFSDYYTAKQALLNAIAAKSATAPLAIIGGDNLAANSSFERMTNGVADGFAIYGAAGTGTEAAGEVVSSAAGSGRAGGLGQVVLWTNSHTGPKGIFGRISAPGWQAGKKYVVSIYAVTTNIASASGLRLNWNTAPASVVAISNPPLSTSWQRYAFLVTWGGVVEPNGGGFISVEYGSGGGNVKFDDLMTVEGELLPGYSTSTAEAVSLAGAAQVAADAAIANDAIIAADNWLSKGEKPHEILKWNTIVGEFSPIQAQADSLLVGHTAFDNAYVTLLNYLNSINTAPAWTDTAVDTPINGATYRTNFLNYYNAKVALLNAIAAKAATTATYLAVPDTRAVNTPPSGYPVGHIKEFKAQDVIGVGAAGLYCVVETMKGWVDSSGGEAIQWAYVSASTIWKRSAGASAASWGAWVRDLDRAIYTGDLNASWGAPVGTNVGSTPATTVESGAIAGAGAASKLNNPPQVNAGPGISEISTGKSKVLPPQTAVVTYGTGPFSYEWTIASTEGTLRITSGQGTATIGLTASVAVNPGFSRAVVTCRVRDAAGLSAFHSFDEQTEFY